MSEESRARESVTHDGRTRESLTHDGLITDEALEAYASRVGSELRIPNVFNEHASGEAIRKFVDGTGDLNPLYRDPAYAGASPYGRLTAPPSWVMSVFPSWVLQGLPGVHVLHTSTDWEFLLPVAEGDRITPRSAFKSFRPMASGLGERTVLEIQEARYENQRGELVARAKVTGIRAEREAMRDAGAAITREIPHPWRDDELDSIERDIVAYERRGDAPRYFEDVRPGDEITPLVKGPLGLTDIIAYCIGAAPVKIAANEAALAQYRRHPAWAFRDPDTGANEPIFGVHYNRHAAGAAGFPYPYDVGSQRHAWLIQALTDWMGDAGWLKRSYAKYSGMVFLGDAVWITGKVTKTYIDEDGECCADVATAARNQRGDNVMPGNATIVLPSRERGSSPVSRRMDAGPARAAGAEGGRE